MATDAILETIKPRRSEDDEQLPVTTATGAKAASAGTRGSGGIGLHRRMSSFSVHVRPLSSSSAAAAAAAFRRARSMPSVKALAAAGALRRWWEWGLGWVTAPFAQPGGGEDEAAGEALGLVGCHCRGVTWRHVLLRLRAGARRLLGRDGRPLKGKAAAPQNFRYDSVSYAQNFDDGEA